MTVKTQAHYQAMKDLIEIMAIASTIGFVADCIWIVRDICVDGVDPSRLVIMVLLDIALLSQSYALIRFHCNLSKSLLCAMITNKKYIQKCKIRNRRNKGGL